MARDLAMPPPTHTEERRLITYLGEDGLPVEKRKRGTIVDGVLGWTDDGFCIHIPTGRNIGPAKAPDGTDRADCLNDRKFILWMLDQDPEGWASSRNYKMGEPLTAALKQRLMLTRDSYPGD